VPQGCLGHLSHSCPTLVLPRSPCCWRRRWSPLLPPPVGVSLSLLGFVSFFSFLFLVLMLFPPCFAGHAMSVREGVTSVRGCVRGSRECRYDCFFITLRWLSRFGCLSHIVRAKPTGCAWHAHASSPPSSQLPTPVYRTESYFPYAGGRSFGYETTTDF